MSLAPYISHVASNDAQSSTTVTIAGVPVVCDNELIIVFVLANDATATDRDITSITYGSDSLTAIDSLETVGLESGNRNTYVYYKTAPTQGSATVTVTFNGTVTTSTACVVVIRSHGGIGQSQTIADPNVNLGTGNLQDIVSYQQNSTLLAFATIDDPAQTSDPIVAADDLESIEFHEDAIDLFDLAVGVIRPFPEGSATVGWSSVGSSPKAAADFYGAILEIKHVSGGGTANYSKSRPAKRIEYMANRGIAVECEIHRYTTFIDAAGAEVKQWAGHISGLPVFMDETGGSEVIRYGQESNRRFVTGFAPHVKDITEKDRLVWNDRCFDIQSVRYPGNLAVSDSLAYMILELEETA